MMTLRTSPARTQNSSEMRLSAAISANAADVVAIENGGWAVIAPYGDFPSPDGSYTQRFDRKQAARVLRSWNSVSGTAARAFKNLFHGFGAKASLPVWDGHPETDKQRWPVERLLAEVGELRLGEAGLEGKLTWNAKGLERRTRGPLYPSPLWWHWPPTGEPKTVYPELLESIGLVTTPNISSVPAWTQNATLSGAPQEENQNQNAMNEEQLKALRKALGLPENADVTAIIAGATTANAAVQQLAEKTTALTTANTAKAEVDGELVKAREALTTSNTQKDQLQRQVNELTTANGTLLTGMLDLAEKRGAITPAERADFQTRLTTANTAAAAITELQTRKAMNTQHVDINGNRVDLSTANSRSTALQAAVSKRMADDKCDYDTAYARVQADPSYSALFSAMADPTKQQG